MRALPIVLLTLLVPAAAFAQSSAPDEEAIARARNHFNAGTAYYDDGRFEDAAREFAEAYRLTNHPDVLFNLASSYDRLDRRDDAIAHYRRYLDEADNPPDRERIERRIRELELMREAEARGETVEDEGSVVEPGRPESSGARGADEGGGGSVLGPLGWGLAGLGVAAGVVAIITGLTAEARYGDLERTCTKVGDRYVCPSGTMVDWQGLKSEGETMATLNTIFLTTAIVSLAAGATLIVLDLTSGGSEPEPTATTLEITTGPTLAGAGARLRF